MLMAVTVRRDRDVSEECAASVFRIEELLE
jgi:hypothetical protein